MQMISREILLVPAIEDFHSLETFQGESARNINIEITASPHRHYQEMTELLQGTYHTVKTRIQEHLFSGFTLIGFLYIGYFR